MAKYVIIYQDATSMSATLVDSDEEKDEVAANHESSSGVEVLAVVDVDYRATSTTVEADETGRVLVTCHLTEEGVN